MTMKTILTGFIIFITFTTFAQTISIQDNTNACYLGPDVVTFSGNDGGSPQRNIYTGTANNGSFPMRIIWNINRWEIQLDTDGNGSYETPTHANSFASHPNPPKLGTGSWNDLTGGICGTISEFQGSGTQTNLPVELTFFDVKLEDNNVMLQWQTSSEINNDKFEIEVSQDGQTFDKISEVKGNGTTLEIQNYQSIIQGLENRRYYFRLKQIDFDGQFEYSKIVNIKVAKSSKASGNKIGSLYPNPSKNGFVYLDYDTIEEEKVNLTIYDLAGKVLFENTQTVNIGQQQLTFDLSCLMKGFYIVQLTTSSASNTQKLIID